MKVLSVVFVLALCTTASFAQFRSQPGSDSRVSEGLIQQASPSLFFGWFNPDKFHMRHSLNFSYQTIGSQGLSLGTYTNSMMYEVADNLNARADVSLSYSPYNSFAKHGQQDLSSIYLSRAQLDYKPWDNFMVQLQYRSVPHGLYSPYSPFASPWYRDQGY